MASLDLEAAARAVIAQNDRAKRQALDYSAAALLANKHSKASKPKPRQTSKPKSRKRPHEEDADDDDHSEDLRNDNDDDEDDDDDDGSMSDGERAYFSTHPDDVGHSDISDADEKTPTPSNGAVSSSSRKSKPPPAKKTKLTKMRDYYRAAAANRRLLADDDSPTQSPKVRSPGIAGHAAICKLGADLAKVAAKKPSKPRASSSVASSSTTTSVDIIPSLPTAKTTNITDENKDTIILDHHVWRVVKRGVLSPVSISNKTDKNGKTTLLRVLSTEGLTREHYFYIQAQDHLEQPVGPIQMVLITGGSDGSASESPLRPLLYTVNLRLARTIEAQSKQVVTREREQHLIKCKNLHKLLPDDARMFPVVPWVVYEHLVNKANEIKPAPLFNAQGTKDARIVGGCINGTESHPVSLSTDNQLQMHLLEPLRNMLDSCKDNRLIKAIDDRREAVKRLLVQAGINKKPNETFLQAVRTEFTAAVPPPPFPFEHLGTLTYLLPVLNATACALFESARTRVASLAPTS